MNAYRLNSIIAALARQAIIKERNIHYSMVYLEVKDIQNDTIITKDGKSYKLKLDFLNLRKLQFNRRLSSKHRN